ncbi:hypothetical protein [Pandoravirus japonicus]|uniref:Uncharacterized protein n=1 Tax=Pandoravirus japonicus TaxID=2823154 RepID=A0A811BLG5_9VIRU|nr:hypothetical protein [Pandoravirus japonicus]
MWPLSSWRSSIMLSVVFFSWSMGLVLFVLGCGARKGPSGIAGRNRADVRPCAQKRIGRCLFFLFTPFYLSFALFCPMAAQCRLQQKNRGVRQKKRCDRSQCVANGDDGVFSVFWHFFGFFSVSNSQRLPAGDMRSQTRRDAQSKQELLAARVQRRRPPYRPRGRVYVASQGIESCPRTLESYGGQGRQRVVIIIIIIVVVDGGGGVVTINQPCVVPGLTRASKNIVADHNVSSVKRMRAVHMCGSGLMLVNGQPAHSRPN